MAAMPEDSVDAVACDPPYGLNFMNKKFDKLGESKAMQAWHERWAHEALRVLKPGGHLLAFGGTRTYHRLVCAIEDAGFEIRDTIQWIQGSGFPKSSNISKTLDKMAGAEQEVVGRKTYPDGVPVRTASPESKNEGWRRPWMDEAGTTGNAYESLPATESAKQWEGWGTALKPAHEPVVCATKPLNIVPELGKIAAESTLLVEALLWWIAPARFVEWCSRLSPSDFGEGERLASVRWIAAALLGTRCAEQSETMATFSSPEAASTFSSIATLWSAILDVLWKSGSTFTTETETRLTTALQTLNSLISATIPESITEAAYHRNGLWSSAETVEGNSTGQNLGWSHIPKPSADENVIWPIAGGIANTLAGIADGYLSAHQVTNGNSVRKPAQTDSTTTLDAKPGPAHEPIVMARKPIAEGSVAKNVLKHGTGAINVDASRVGNGGQLEWAEPRDMGYHGGTNNGKVEAQEAAKGRWPANLLLSHHPECNGECVDSCPVRLLGQESRFFKNFEPDPSPGFRYVSKASRRERNEGLEGMPETTAHRYSEKGQGPLPQQTPRVGVVEHNAHPTVKPLALMRYLVKMVTPPGGTVLDPFAGSGSTGVACIQEGFDCVLIEQDESYAEITRARVEHAQAQTEETLFTA